MSFGLNDEDWVEPEPTVTVKCRYCEYWAECPSGCGWGWCTDNGEFTKSDEECEFEQ